MRLKICRFPLYLSLGFFSSATGISSAQEPGQTVALIGARLIDGSGDAPLENGALVIQGDKIVATGPADSVKFPKDAAVIDSHGQTIIPGLISDHSHVGLVDGISVKPENYNQQNILRQLRQYEAYGVTTVTALGLNGSLFYQLRDDQHAGKSPGADLFGAFRGIGVPLGAPPATMIPVSTDQIYRPETPEEARTAVRESVAGHPDLVKIWVDDLLGTSPKMKPEIYEAVIDEAHRAGIRVAAHIYYLEDAKAVLKAGVDIIAHGVRDQPVDVEFINEMKARSVWYIATLNLDECFYILAEQPAWTKEPFFQNALQPALKAQLNDPAYLEKTLKNPKIPIFETAVVINQANLKTLYDAGVNVAFGADSGGIPTRIPGFAEHRELQLMVASGLTPLQAISCATSRAAALLNLTDRGTLKPGQLADLIVLTANPLDDITNSEKIAVVWHRGKKIAGPAGDFHAE
jgi:imidazolonepropionase-like amidohydrolase